MRMRKKPWADQFLNDHNDYVLKAPELYKGKWRDLLGNTGALHLEIGCGKGDYFLGMHALNPEDGFIAVERDPSCIAVACKKALETDHEHTVMVNSDASSLLDWFEKGEIDVLHLNFSDPWPKKGHSKRRLSNEQFLEKYKYILSENGIIQMKSDNRKLFEYSIVEFSKCNFEILEISVDYRNPENEPGDVITEYERKFMDLGQPIYRVVCKAR